MSWLKINGIIMDLLKWIILIVYIGIIILIGIIGKRKTTNSKDLLFGGGKIGAIMSAFSYGTAYFSAVLFIGFAGQIGWNFGLSGLWIAVINAVVGVFSVWAVIGWRMKKASLDQDSHTLGEYLEKRYDNKAFRVLSTFIIFIFLIPYSAAVFVGLSYLFTTNFEISYWVALMVIGILTAFYLSMGGYKSVALIDVFFGIIMVFGVIILFITTLQKGQGLGEIYEVLQTMDKKLVAPIGPPGFWNLFTLVFLTSIAPFAMPQLLQKFVSISNKKAIKKGAIASTLFALLIGSIAYFVGACTRIFINVQEYPQVFENEQPIYDRLMPEMLSHVVPEYLSLIMLLLILAASMSSLASMVLTSSSTFTKDLYSNYIKKNVTDQQISKMSKITMIVFVFLSILLALANFDSIVVIMGISWGAIGSFFLGPVIWGLYGNEEKFTGTKALIGGLGGLCVCLLLFLVGRPSPEAGTIGMIISFLVPVILSPFKFQKKNEAKE